MMTGMKLVSNNARVVSVRHLQVEVVADGMPLGHVAAEVEEQDVALLLAAHDEQREFHPDDKQPAWYLSHKMESQTLHKPGDVLFRYSAPLRLLALVHDFDRQPSWNDEWVARALSNIARMVEEKNIVSLRLPVLGACHGRIDMQVFVKLFILSLLKNPPPVLQRVQLVVDPDRFEEIYSALEAYARERAKAD